jgi:hypothetical protein
MRKRGLKRQRLIANETLYQLSYTPFQSGPKNYAGDSEPGKLMRNTKSRGEGDLRGIRSSINAVTTGKIGGVIIVSDLLRRWRDRRLSFGFERLA